MQLKYLDVQGLQRISAQPALRPYSLNLSKVINNSKKV